MDLRRLLREPLLHFLLLGGLLFAVYAWIGERDTPNATIVVDQGRVAALSAQFERLWHRAPTSTELQGLIDAWVREEILYREGLAAGVDRNDDIVRRRVVQKMRFLAETAVARVPTEAELEAWWRAHPQDYRVPPTYTLQQEYLDAQPGTSMLPSRLVGASTADVARTFGTDFSDALTGLPTGTWSQPIRSGFGLHRVLIEARTAGGVAPLSDVRAAVERDFLAARTRQVEDEFYASARRRYTVEIDTAHDTASPQ